MSFAGTRAELASISGPDRSRIGRQVDSSLRWSDGFTDAKKAAQDEPGRLFGSWIG
jgi:hypothetical protein